ncbi:MAG: HAD family phosphatase [Solobacterium sp.]|nr:HAD family phosphatase [Solobacterium sp.]
MYRLIASDLDETLIKADRTVCEENIEAIKKFMDMGGYFVCATGRPFFTAFGTLKELGQYEKEGQYVISFNGGAITENKGNRLLHYEGITFEQASELYKRGLKYDVCMHVYTLDTVYTYNMNPGEVEYLDNRQEFTEIFTDNIDFLKDTEIVKCLYENTYHEYLRSIAAELTDITDDMDVSYTSNRYLEFNKKGVNKGAGLLRLADLLGIDHKDTIAIGDNYNDLAMIKAAGLGVGVANTIESMKPECDVITERDCDHGAVAEVIEKYVFNAKD